VVSTFSVALPSLTSALISAGRNGQRLPRRQLQGLHPYRVQRGRLHLSAIIHDQPH
jgi:hypothetical protein